MVGTVARSNASSLRDGFVHALPTEQSVDGLPPGEGVFLRARSGSPTTTRCMGRMDEARALFERLLALRNDVGLLAEEYDPRARRLLGNFPQAFSHVGLINTAFNLSPDHPTPAGRA